MMLMPSSFVIIACVCLSVIVPFVDGRHRIDVPPRGWNSWNWIGCDTSILNEVTIRRVADDMVKTGLSTSGYVYINIDDCWMEKGKREKGVPLQEDKKRFPNGMKALGDYIHSKGLKFGLYQDVGSNTCAGDPGTDGNEELDAKTFADWGIDYLKEDGCHIDASKMEERYTAMSKALLKNENPNNPIVYSCSWPVYASLHPQGGKKVTPEKFPWMKIRDICDTWRFFEDVEPHYSSILKQIDYLIEHQDIVRDIGQTGAYFDMDIMEVGNGLTYDEGKTQLSILAMWASPLLIGANVGHLDKKNLALLKNEEFLGVSSHPGPLPFCQVNGRLWSGCIRQLEPMKAAVMLINKSSEPIKNIPINLPSGVITTVRDVWAGKTLGNFTDTYVFSSPVPAHGVNLMWFTFHMHHGKGGGVVDTTQLYFQDDKKTSLRSHKAIE